MQQKLFALLAVLAVVLAGCLGDGSDAGSDDGNGEGDATGVGVGSGAAAGMTFSDPLIVDATRAGGEPVIAITQAGSILLSAHPGWTHYHPSDDPTHVGTELIEPVSGQSYLWKSEDGGTTWRHIGVPGMEEGPRSTGFGVSDPEFTVMPDGTICYTDLEGLAMSSVSCSTDDGETWTGNPIASQRPNDRQWMASFGDELYFTANYFTDHNLIASTDKGLTWETRGDVPCSGDIIAHPVTGGIYAGCSYGIAVSEDAGFTWETRMVGGVEDGAPDGHMTEPAIDGGDNVWMVWTEEEHVLRVGGTPDEGASWPWVHDVTGAVRGALATTPAGAGLAASDDITMVWPWISAGSQGRLAATVFASASDAPSAGGAADRPWSVVTVAVFGADTDTPSVVAYVVDELFHNGPICQSGTACQLGSVQGDDASDRRLGDFFETTIDPDGYLHITYSETDSARDDVISHPAYVRQTGGPLFVAPGDTFAPTQG